MPNRGRDSVCSSLDVFFTYSGQRLNTCVTFRGPVLSATLRTSSRSPTNSQGLRSNTQPFQTLNKIAYLLFYGQSWPRNQGAAMQVPMVNKHTNILPSKLSAPLWQAAPPAPLSEHSCDASSSSAILERGVPQCLIHEAPSYSLLYSQVPAVRTFEGGMG